MSEYALRDRRVPPAPAAAISVAAGAAIALLHPSVDSAVVVGLALATLAPIAIRVATRRFDVFEPIVVANLALFVMYVARPAGLLLTNRDEVFKGYAIGGRVHLALLLALLGVCAFELGYALPGTRRVAGRLPLVPGRWDRQSTTVFALGLASVATLLFSVFLHQSGGLGALRALLAGRGAEQTTWFEDSSAYLYGAPELFWPASLLLIAMGVTARRRVFVVLGAVLTIPLAVFAGGQGSRIVLLPLVLTPVVYAFLATRRRPKLPVLLLAAYLVFTVGIAYFRDTRDAGAHVSRMSELARSLTHPGYEYDQLVFHGTDNDMFESLAAETIVVPSQLPISPLDFAYRTLAKPIPSRLWHGKPLAPEEELTHVMYPSETSRASSSSGLVGNLYQAGGAIGVAIGMALAGFLFRIPWAYWRRARESSAAQLLLAAFLMFVPILLRGAIGDTLARALFGIVPLLVAVRVCIRRHA